MTAPIAVIADPHGLDTMPAVEILNGAGFEVRVADTRDPELIVPLAADAVAFITGYARVDAALLDRLPKVQIVATMSSGVDMVDLDAARGRGLWVCNLPDASTEEVAVHGVALTLALLRALPTADKIVRSGRWWQDMTVEMHRPSTLTVGVLGAGRIARHYMDRVRPLFGKVVAYDPFVPDESWPEGVERADLDTVLETSDVVSLHVPLTDETRNLIDADRIAKMRRGAVVINVSRGGLIDELALAEALDSGQLFGAGLDVFASEPPHMSSPLLGHDRVILSPHSAYMSVESRLSYVCLPAENIASWRRTGRPNTPVLGPAPAS